MGVEENREPRQASDRDRGLMKMKRDKDGLCCQLLAFWRKENKNASVKIIASAEHEAATAWSGV